VTAYVLHDRSHTGDVRVAATGRLVCHTLSLTHLCRSIAPPNAQLAVVEAERVWSSAEVEARLLRHETPPKLDHQLFVINYMHNGALVVLLFSQLSTSTLPTRKYLDVSGVEVQRTVSFPINEATMAITW